MTPSAETSEKECFSSNALGGEVKVPVARMLTWPWLGGQYTVIVD